MALAPLHKCNEPGCRVLVRGSARCPEHTKAIRRNAPSQKNRATAHERGYGADWRKLRKQKLACDPLCEDCAEEGRTTAAAEVHHKVKIVDDPGGRLEWSNLMSLCAECHWTRTARGE